MRQPYRFGLLGQNISYSWSPGIFSTLFSLLGHAGEFQVVDCDSDELESQLEIMRSWDGFSVTVPYKKVILSRMHRLCDEARAIGAVNSVRVDKGRFIGYNTDAEGFWGPLKRLPIRPDRILVLGNGGAAAAVLWVLLREFPKAGIDICGRNENSVKDFVDGFRLSSGTGKTIGKKIFAVVNADAGYDMIVNCTPAGGPADPGHSPLSDEFNFRGCQVCYDLNYRPAKTALMKQAEAAGCRIIGGFPMLVGQAVASYAIWTACELDREGLCNEIIELSGGIDKGGVL